MSMFVPLQTTKPFQFQFQIKRATKHSGAAAPKSFGGRTFRF